MNLGQPGQLSTILKSVPGRDITNDRLVALEKAVAALTVARSADYATVDGTLSVPGTLNVAGNANIGGNTVMDGTTVIGGTTTLDGALTLANGAVLTSSGDLKSSNYVAGVSGWKLDGTTGNLEINNVTIRGGIITNDALTSPVDPAVANSGANTGLTFTTSWATYASSTITVPSGFTTALVLAIPNAVAPSNVTGAVVECSVRALVNGGAGPQFDWESDQGTGGSAPYGVLLSGLSGSFTVECQALAVGNSTHCIASITAIALFQR